MWLLEGARKDWDVETVVGRTLRSTGGCWGGCSPDRLPAFPWALPVL
jgi:hypothetical protein